MWASPRPPRQWAVLQVADANKASQGQSMEPDCDVENLKIQTKSKASVQNNGCRSKLTPAKRSSTGQSMEPDCDVEELKKTSYFYIFFNKKLGQGVPPGRQKNELGSNLAQDASKSGFKEALDASWGCLGRPKREPSWSKIEAGRVFF